MFEGFKKCFPAEVIQCFPKIAKHPANIYTIASSLRKKKLIPNPAFTPEYGKIYFPELYRVSRKSSPITVEKVRAISGYDISR